MKKRRYRFMAKDYDMKKMSSMRALTRDTKELSMLAARYYIYTVGDVMVVEVRCRKNSKVYKLCELKDYAWMASVDVSENSHKKHLL